MSELPDEIHELLKEHQVDLDEVTDGGVDKKIIESVIEDVKSLDRENKDTTVEMLRVLTGTEGEEP